MDDDTKQKIVEALMRQKQEELTIDGYVIPTSGTPESPDYNTEAYIAKYGIPDQSKGQHLTDEFKLPNHMTFSNQSIYSNPYTQGGMWQQGGNDRWNFTPSNFNMAQHSAKEISDYFMNRERRGTFVTLPNGAMIEGKL